MVARLHGEFGLGPRPVAVEAGPDRDPPVLPAGGVAFLQIVAVRVRPDVLLNHVVAHAMLGLRAAHIMRADPLAGADPEVAPGQHGRAVLDEEALGERLRGVRAGAILDRAARGRLIPTGAGRVADRGRAVGGGLPEEVLETPVV